MSRLRRFTCVCLSALLGVSLLALVTVSPPAHAEQLICVPATGYDRAASDLDTVNGNKWQEFNDADGILPVAMTAPGNNDTSGGPNRPWLVYPLPVNVKAGESTADGKKWQIWVHMRVKQDANSFYWQTSSNGKDWLPASITNANRVNDDAQNNSDKWYWQDQLTGNAGAVDPVLAVGKNYLRIGSREAKPEAENSPRFDVACLRNYGDLGEAGAPDDAEVAALIAATPVDPQGKLAATWGTIKTAR